jgi:uncharacterized protein (DUF4415 family)
MMRKPDWTEAASLPPEELDRLLADDLDEVDDNPPATAAQIAAARPGKRRPGERGPGRKPAKVMVALRLDPDTAEAWRASGPGWQTRVNELLAREAPKAKRRA